MAGAARQSLPLNPSESSSCMRVCVPCIPYDVRSLEFPSSASVRPARSCLRTEIVSQDAVGAGASSTTQR